MIHVNEVWTAEVFCPRCDAILRVNQEDLILRSFRNDKGEGEYCKVECMECERMIEVEGVPRFIRNRLRKEG